MSTATSERALEATPQPRKPFYTNLGFQIVVGLIVGLVLGLIAVAIGADGEERNWLATLLSEVGNAYVSLLTLLVVPLVVTAVISSISRLREVANAARLAVQTLVWFAITAFASVVVGIAVGLLSAPWLTAGVNGEAAAEPSRVGSWSAFLLGLIPNNFLGLGVRISGDPEAGFTAAANFSVLQVLLISILFGVAALKVGDKAAPLVGFMESALSVIQKVLWWIIRLAPIGTAALIGKAVATYGWTSLASLGSFVVALYIGLIIVWAVVYPAILKAHGLSVRQFYRNVWPAISLGFVTRSSMGTMPVTEQVVERNLGVARQYASFAVPLGATTKMDGCAAVFPALASIFVAQFYGIDLGVTHYLLIAFVAVLGSSATAGTTGATVMLTLTLSTLGLPLAGVGLLLAVEPIVDMGRTALNVTGQALVAAVVGKREGILDQATYDAEPQFSA
ncbi:dicarboxylate/amino acid:cation symporter [Tessaracoccus sp. MC1627]|uniref:dicarboxylate/amino acid:cation symporter n=1 Tax=Tessaracoccus sp. MC1627 TaxID=2760312 RepID=UPI001C7285BE|nr:dicarboxylate/amino acid:cation symporter [Tessaracoccus sp. MC1627]